MPKRPPKTMLYEFLAHVPDLDTDGAGVEEVGELAPDTLQKLFNEKICAIHVPSFFSAQAARTASKIILQQSKIKNYDLPLEDGSKCKTDVNYGLGFPRRLGFSSEKYRQKYFREALGSTRKIRAAFAPSLSPVDRFRLELDEVWGAGASLSHIDGKAGLAGSLRHMDPIPTGLAHIDDFLRTKHQRTFSACFYLDLPKKGGELEIWNVSLTDKNRRNPLFQVCNTFEPGTQAVIRERYPQPLKVKPKAGDLILFDAGRPHAVGGFAEGHRMVLQIFVVYRGPNKPLSLVS
jgi:hypothetical protein